MTRQGSARAIADLFGGIILAEVDIAAPPERVFRALTESSEILRWWGSPDAYRTESWTSDLRPGGAWRAEGRGADGAPFSVGGTFVAVEPPHRLVQTWVSDWDQARETTLTYQLLQIEGGTRLSVRHEGFSGRPDSCRAHAQGWELVLGWLFGHFEAAADPAERFYLCRLLSPRPSFPQDMTAEEASVMQAHAAYWREHLRQGTAIVFGPVADPKGVWGLGVVRVASEEQLRAFEAGDPVIQANKGFRYEVLPMLQAVVRA